MSYACIDQEELNRRGLCEGVSCAPPSIIRETIFEPIMEPLFASDPFVPANLARGAGGRFGGGSRFGGGRSGGRSVPWQPRHQQVLTGPSGPLSTPSTPSGRTGPSMGPTSHRAGSAAPSGGGRMVARPPTATANYRQAAPRMVAYQQPVRSNTTQAPARMVSHNQPRPVSAMKGLGQIADGVSGRWKYAAVGLGALVVAQFFWWNAKAPQVLRLGGY